MKKITNLILTLCLVVGMISGLNYFIYAEENSNIYVSKTEEYSPEQKKQLENYNYVFSQEELKNTSYVGHHVEVKNGVMYVDERSATTVVIWFLVSGYPKIAGWIAAGGVIKAANNYVIKQDLKVWLKNAYNKFSNMTDAYCENQKLKSVKLSNGNEFVPTSFTTYACKYSVD